MWILLITANSCRLYRERVTQVEAKLEEVRGGEAAEYLVPLEELQEAMRVRLEVACVLRQLRLQNINNKHEAEVLAAKQNFEVSRVAFYCISLRIFLLSRVHIVLSCSD